MPILQMPECFSSPFTEASSLSPDFIQRAVWMGFSNVRQIVETKEKELMKNVYFNMTWFTELLDYLNENQALHILDHPSRF